MREERERREERDEQRGRDALPCVRSKSFHVYVQNARVLCDTGVLKVHTGAFFNAKQEEAHNTHHTPPHTHTPHSTLRREMRAMKKREM